MTNGMLAIRASNDARLSKRVETHEPTALWGEDSEREAARTATYTLVDPATVFITHISEMLKQQTASLLTRTGTYRLL